MKIIISPSKTKKISDLKNITIYEEPYFPKITNEIVSEIKKMNVSEIEKKFKLKNGQAEKLSEFYKTFENQLCGHALSTYTGIAYKSINIESFDKEELEFAQNNLIILSALYGILTPFSKLKEYRLDMVNSIFEQKSLYEIWKKPLSEYFKNEEQIINLASKEYSKLVNSNNVYDFEFYDEKDGKLKQISTNSKKMRGFTVNYIVKNKIINVENLKNINLGEYKYNKEMSGIRKYVYIK
ncbi:YaaA family protein [Leptotrichia sp. OH3620_COT-345]|uniref:YaaA family protein n=1 Tax=Leptotrichia sp. OH3620_COT-345 TaxID=2491048 RepID=UPI000F64C89F|nr:YaaA family protein [Leptotrichia sp. OH3620_COT-345]RRD39155.1 YaaA family protein [Leptotrichia sp. OH3620_COT-345]